MLVHITDNKSVATITLDSNFDFNVIEEFRQTYTEHSAKEYIIDFKNTEYMDSSGLGMLLNMNRYLEGTTDKISLINCRTQVKKVLMISCFDQKFSIS